MAVFVKRAFSLNCICQCERSLTGSVHSHCLLCQFGNKAESFECLRVFPSITEPPRFSPDCSSIIPFSSPPPAPPPPPPRPLPRRMAAIRAAQRGESDNATRAAEVGEDGKGAARTKEGCGLSEKTSRRGRASQDRRANSTLGIQEQHKRMKRG